MIKQHITMKGDIGYLTDHPHLKAHIVAQMHIHGSVPIADVAEQYGVELADVYAAIAFYYDNRTKIEQAHAEKQNRARILGGKNFQER
ncbi:MAG: hypothetical protein WBC91_20870 [Phototrophicaceae bacterium]|jgi:hypothetical protein